MTNTIEYITNEVARNLNIDPIIILNALPSNLLNVQINNSELLNTITNLLKSDKEINSFGLRNNLGDNYTILKNNLGKLQLLSLTKNLNKAEKCDDILNAFIEMMNNKISKVNDFLQINLQSGGNQINYYKKYKKYKKKYLLFKKI
mgnify:CR=1 FL=1